MKNILLVSFLVIILFAACLPVETETPIELPQATATISPSPTIEPPIIFTLEPTEIPEPTPIGGGAGRIVITSNMDGDFEIYLYETNGSGYIKLTDNEYDDFFMQWSPDGKKMLFNSNRDGNYELYVMDQDGSNLINLTNSNLDEVDGEISPDGSLVVFKTKIFGNFEICTIKLDGSDLKRLTENTDADDSPFWTPDGEHIIFLKDDIDFYQMKKDGSEQEKMFALAQKCSYGYISEDGNKIYAVCRIDPNVNPWPTFEMNLDGTGLNNLTEDESIRGIDHYSPDQSMIAFSDTLNGQLEIFIMNSDGTNLHLLQENDFSKGNPKWSPDGKKIAYSTSINGEETITLISDLDGLGKIQFGAQDANYYLGDWQP